MWTKRMQNIGGIRPTTISMVATTAMSLFALVYGIGGFYRLEALHSMRTAALSGPNWTVFYGPPDWMFLCLVTLMAILALSLAWRTPRSASAVLLGLYVALIACGYGLLVTVQDSPINALFIRAVRPLIQSGVDREFVLAIGHIVAALERSLWLAGWAFAGPVCIHFCTRLLDCPLQPRRKTAEVAGILAAWAFVVALLPTSGVIRLTSAVLAAMGLATAFLDRQGHPRSARSKLPLLASVVILVQMWFSLLGENEPVLGMVAGAVILLLVLPQVAASNLFVVYVPALLLSMLSALTVQNLDYVIGVTLVWVGVCVIAMATLIVSSIRSLPLDSSRQALWLLSGFLIAGFCAISWKLFVLAGNSYGCVASSTTAICLLYRYDEWLFAAPLLIILAFCLVALQYRGHIDAATFFRRTTIYGTLVVISIFSFGVLEAWLEGFLGGGLPSGTPPIIAGGALAVVLHPAKKLCDRLVNPLLSRLLNWADQAPR